MRKSIILALALFTGQPLFAQSEAVSIHAVGKAYYYPPQQNKAQPIHPGQRLSLDGRVRVASGGSVKLLYRGETFTVSGGKTLALRDLEQRAAPSASLGFFGRFWSFLSNSLEQAKDEKNLEEHYRRYMESAHAAVKGFAQQSHTIRASRLYSGKMGSAPVTFRWSGMDPEGRFLFLLSAKADARTLVSVQVRDSALTLDFAQLPLLPDSEYEWEIRPADERPLSLGSDKTPFWYAPQTAAKILNDLLPDHEYQHATPTEQLLMQAYALENAGFYYEAGRKYAAAAADQRNLLSRGAQAAFLARMGLLDEAKSLVKR